MLLGLRAQVLLLATIVSISVEGNQDPRLAIEGCRSPGFHDFIPLPLITSPSHPQIVRGQSVYRPDDVIEIQFSAEPLRGIYQQWSIINSASPSTEKWTSNSLSISFKPVKYGVYTVVLGAKSKQGICGYVGFQFAVLNTEEVLPAEAIIEWMPSDQFPYLKKIQVPERLQPFTGKKVRIAVLDSGINLNTPDLRHAIARNEDGSIIGKNFIQLDLPPHDELGHGTFVAGILGGAMSGIARDRVELVPYKIVNSFGIVSESMILSSLVSAVASRPDIIYLNASCEKNCPQIEKSLQKVLDQYIYPSKILVVTSAGDVKLRRNKTVERDNDKEKFYPGSLKSPALLTVTALDEKSVLAETSRYGSKSTHLAAPGLAQSACNYLSHNGKTQYCEKSDSSIASAQVTGAIALTLSESPGLNVFQAAERVIASGDENNSLLGKTVSGRTLNINQALHSKH
ncbi:MAG: S8 family serine peptidase [Xanthomonadaceae bacterium]|nr:S8 family serine peptidase [Xanthomonadaceae bacterium]